MDFKPFLHKHHLLFDEYENQEAFCDECNQKISGVAFTCELCKFWLDQSCAKKKLPPKISPSLHSELFLQRLYLRDFICDKCFTLSRGYKYSNEDQSFNLDVMCAFSIHDQTVKEDSKRSKDIVKKIEHFCHSDPLTLFNYRKVRWYEYCCSWCEKPLSGMSYGCAECFRPVLFHQFCLDRIPLKILKHTFHPHPLYIRSVNLTTFIPGTGICAVCIDAIYPDNFCYSCSKCDFHVHILCAKFNPTLRHECHNHDFTYITAKGEGPECQKCKGHVKSESSLYRCVQCQYNYHFECLIPPSLITHKYHTHSSLTVMTSFREDGLEEYYCDICEEQRNPEHPIYYCKECTYIAHIECVLGNKVIDAKLQLESTSSWKHEETQQKDLDFPTHRETINDSIFKTLSISSNQNKDLVIEHVDHRHRLIFQEAIEKWAKRLCEACEEEICDQAYVCQRKSCGYYLHKKCAELSNEVLHPLHDHPLIPLASNDFICDNCREVSRGSLYRCFQCNFKSDIKCVVGTSSNIEKQGPKGIERPTNLFHFEHKHELLLFNCRPTSNRSFECGACSLKISGPAYCCLECKIYVHESCLRKLPREIQIQSHPQHNLLPHTEIRTPGVCLACKRGNPSFWYKCLQCDIYIHFYCVSSLLQRPLSSKSHSHNLYLFTRNKPRLLQKHQFSKCGKCNKLLENQSIYHCLECDANFHLQCVEIFYRVKCKHHIHPLTLEDCFVEDDLEEYYCDVCEEERDPKNDVYYCEECGGLFITHIECAVAGVEEVLLQYSPAPSKESEEMSTSSSEETEVELSEESEEMSTSSSEEAEVE